MPRSADPSRSSAPRRTPLAADGFTLMEIVVALGVITIVMLALLPQLVVGIRSTGVARAVTEMKGIAQGEVERMRNLPFHISREAGQYVDVLDRYYPDSATTPSGVTCTGPSGTEQALPESATGFVPATAARCGYEPPAGSAFFRTVRTQPASGDTSGHTVVVDAQFLSDATPPTPVLMGGSYDSQTTGRDNPPASQLGVTVTVFSARYPDREPVSVYTQIAAQPPATTRLRGRAGVRALEIGTVVLDPDGPDADTDPEKVPLSLSAGLMNLAGSVSTASKMNVSRGAIVPMLGTDVTSYGLSAVHSAPPGSTTPALTHGEGQLPQGCAYACWGGSTLNSVPLSASDGLPNAGSAMLPVRSELTSGANHWLSLGNAPNPSGYIPSLGLTGNLVQLDTDASRTTPTLATCASSGGSLVDGAGYVTSTAADVATCATASSTVIELFHTAAAPDGVVRVELVGASASCRVQGATHTATADYDYQLLVSYWDAAAGAYQQVGPITKATTTDLLAAVDLTTVDVGGGKVLGDYIASWSSLTPDRVKQVAGGGVAEVSIPGVATISTQPTRPDTALPAGDTPSVVSLTLGALSCFAEDRR